MAEKAWNRKVLELAKATPEWRVFPPKARRTLELVALRYLTPELGCIAFHGTIAKAAGVSRRTVIRHLELAVRCGILTKRTRDKREFGVVGVNGQPLAGKTSTEYRFVVSLVQQNVTGSVTGSVTSIGSKSLTYKRNSPYTAGREEEAVADVEVGEVEAAAEGQQGGWSRSVERSTIHRSSIATQGPHADPSPGQQADRAQGVPSHSSIADGLPDSPGVHVKNAETEEERERRYARTADAMLTAMEC